jgi:AraC-like DNA-binding protein
MRIPGRPEFDPRRRHGLSLAYHRFSMSKRLLAGTDEPIDRIVYLTGFAEVSTFYRAFRRWPSKTPVQYRQEKQKSKKQAVG